MWRIASPVGELLYVGRTGDSSSPHAATPFARMGQHLGTNEHENMVRRHLEQRGAPPERCTSFDLIAHGPLFPEAQDWPAHKERRDVVAALEKALAEGLARAGYDVLNKVRDRHAIDTRLWSKVREAFTVHFPELGQTSEPSRHAKGT